MRLAPPWSTISLITVGFDHGKLVGASASSTVLAANRAWRSWRQSRSASEIRPSTASPSGQVRLQQSPKQPAGVPRRVGEAPVALRRADLGAPARDTRQLRAQTPDAARRPVGSARETGSDADGRSGTEEPRSSPAGRVGEHHVQRGMDRIGSTTCTGLARGLRHPLITHSPSPSPCSRTRVPRAAERRKLGRMVALVAKDVEQEREDPVLHGQAATAQQDPAPSDPLLQAPSRPPDLQPPTRTERDAVHPLLDIPVRESRARKRSALVSGGGFSVVGPGGWGFRGRTQIGQGVPRTHEEVDVEDRTC